MPGPQQSGSNQANSLVGTYNFHLGQTSSPIIQLLLEVIHCAGIINQNNLGRVDSSLGLKKQISDLFNKVIRATVKD